jgi:hypothetical protein
MPEYDVELEVTYYTDEEVAEMEEAEYTAGVDLTPSADGKTWTLAATPAFDIELEVEYKTDLALNEVDDNNEKLTEWNGYEADVTLTRTLQAGGYNTFAVPFNIDAIPSGWTVKALTDASYTAATNTLSLTFGNASSIVAGKPYLVKVTENADLSQAAFAGAIVSKDAEPFTSANVAFTPTLGKTPIEGSDAKAVLFLAENNTLKNPESLPANMKGFRAYFQLKGDAEAEARAFRMSFDDASGIEEIDDLPIDDLRFASGIYTLDGRRIPGQPTQKGVYIVNGKKTIIK